MNISTYALENDDKLFFIAMLTMAANGLELSERDLILVDIEQTEGKKFWLKYHTEKQLIAFAHQNMVDATWFLEKPIELAKLKALLKLLSQKSKKQPIVEPTPIVEPNDIFDPSLFLTGVFLKPEAICIKAANFAPLYLLPEQNSCFTTVEFNFRHLTSEQIKFFETEVSQIETESLTVDDIAIQSDLHKYPIESFLWATTLCSSKGKLLNGISVDETKILLKQWPDFSILVHEIAHIRLAAIMVRQSLTLKSLADRTQIPIETVVNFFNACFITQLVEIETHNNEIITNNESIYSSEQHSIFKSILNKLE